jgi:hypothetical protein
MIYLLKMVIFGFKTYIDKRMGNYEHKFHNNGNKWNIDGNMNGHIKCNISEIYGNIYHL